MGKFPQVCVKVRTKSEEKKIGHYDKEDQPFFIGLGFRV